MPGPKDNPNWEEAVRNIAEVKKSGETFLPLYSLNLEDIPELQALPLLTGIALNHNRLNSIPESLSRSEKILTLGLQDNEIESIPDFVGRVPAGIKLRNSERLASFSSCGSLQVIK